MFKKYGESRIDSCPFCGKISTTKNQQKIPVCQAHKNEKLPDFKCICGEWLDIQESKYGSYFRCMRCGNISFKKAMEMNSQQIKAKPKTENISTIKENQTESKITTKENNKPKEITVRSDELDYLF